VKINNLYFALYEYVVISYNFVFYAHYIIILHAELPDYIKSVRRFVGQEITCRI